MDEILSVAWCLGLCGRRRTAQPCDQGIELAAQADGEGRIEESRHHRERGGNQTQQRDAAGEPDDAGDGEPEADQLGKLQRRHRFSLRDRPQPGRHEVGEHRAVGVPAARALKADTISVIASTTVVDHAEKCGPRTSTWVLDPMVSVDGGMETLLLRGRSGCGQARATAPSGRD